MEDAPKGGSNTHRVTALLGGVHKLLSSLSGDMKGSPKMGQRRNVIVMSAEALPTLTKDDLEELLNSKVDSFTISPLTAPGENYGSTMLLVNVVLLPDHRKMSVVAKMVSQYPHMREFFHFRDTVRKEIYVYTSVQREFHAIQEEYKVPEDLFLDVIPRCYGARTSRGGGIDQPVDETSAILMENLKVSGYRLVDRIVGLDLNHLEYAVTLLARFHATAVVIKLKKPDVFNDTVMKAAADYNRKPPPGKVDHPGPVGILNNLSDLPIVRQYGDKIKEALQKGFTLFKKGLPPQRREPFATLVHDDLWTNNMMFTYGGSHGESITGLKIFDFQKAAYASPAIDLLFLLYSSRTIDVTSEDCNNLIALYHDEFTKWLNLFDCDTKPFSYDNFMNEVNYEACTTFTHTFVMLKISSISENNAPDISSTSGNYKIFKEDCGIGEIYFKKVENLVREFMERKWI